MQQEQEMRSSALKKSSYSLKVFVIDSEIRLKITESDCQYIGYEKWV